MTNLCFIKLVALVALFPSAETFSLLKMMTAPAGVIWQSVRSDDSLLNRVLANAPGGGQDVENVSDDAAQLFGRRWWLTEVNGAAVRTTKPYIEFDRGAKRFAGDGGCNRISGGFEINGSNLRFSRVISTRRACIDREDQQVETEFLRRLEQTTSFQIQDGILRLYAGGSAILAFRQEGQTPPTPPQDNPYIVLFDRTNYRGNPRNYNGPVPDLYGRRAQSVTIGRGVWELCEGRNFTGRCVTLDRSVPNLGTYNLRNRVSSVRPIEPGGSTPPPSTGNWYIVIFERANYQGNPANYNGTETNIFKLARSVTIGRGVWELCQGRNFTGRCITLDRSVPDLRPYNLRQVASLRPVIRRPR